PDHVIDVRKTALAKSGSSRPPDIRWRHRHQLRSSVAPKRSTAAIVPPALSKERTHSTSPSDLTKEDRHSSTTGPNSCRAHWGAMKARTGCPQASAARGTGGCFEPAPIAVGDFRSKRNQTIEARNWHGPKGLRTAYGPAPDSTPSV